LTFPLQNPPEPDTRLFFSFLRNLRVILAHGAHCARNPNSDPTAVHVAAPWVRNPNFNLGEAMETGQPKTLSWIPKRFKVGRAVPMGNRPGTRKDNENMRLCGTDPFILQWRLQVQLYKHLRPIRWSYTLFKGWMGKSMFPMLFG
jgi:hypothetical protein